jgi:MFS family permease
MQKSLGLSPNQYNWALSIFFIGYVLFETPSNVILKRLRPRIYIPFLTVSISLSCVESDTNRWAGKITWGVVCCCVSVVDSAAGLLAARFFLGIAEAGFLPGIIYWGKLWYSS